jgi:L-asparaginase
LVKILVVYTGGTIGSVHRPPTDLLSPLVPGTWDEISSLPIVRDALLELENKDDLTVKADEFNPTLDSSNMSPKDWIDIATKIQSHYNDYQGFVVLHGTDTMTYTATALSFILQNLTKPVIVTGSQLPISSVRTDAVQNFITSLRIAAGEYMNPPLPLVPEVCIFFQNKLIRGNRSRKINASGYDAFDSPNYPLLGEAGEYIEIRKEMMVPKPDGELSLKKSLEKNVMSFDIFPGIQSSDVMNRIMQTSDLKGLVLKTYGTGNAPTDENFLKAIEEGVKRGVVVVDVTQCLRGKVEIGLYETSAGLLTRGVVSGADMTPEAALCKLMLLLKMYEPSQAKDYVQQDLHGEQSESIYNLDYGEGTADPEKRTKSIPITGILRTENLTHAVIKAIDVTLDGPVGTQFRVSTFINLTEDVPKNFEEQERMTEYCDYRDVTWTGKPVPFLPFEATGTARNMLARPSLPVSVTMYTDKFKMSWRNLSLTLIASVGKASER